MLRRSRASATESFPSGNDSPWSVAKPWRLVLIFLGGCRIPAVFRVRVLNFSSRVYRPLVPVRLTVSPNYTIPANSFYPRHFPVSRSNVKTTVLYLDSNPIPCYHLPCSARQPRHRTSLQPTVVIIHRFSVRTWINLR